VMEAGSNPINGKTFFTYGTFLKGFSMVNLIPGFLKKF